MARQTDAQENIASLAYKKNQHLSEVCWLPHLTGNV